MRFVLFLGEFVTTLLPGVVLVVGVVVAAGRRRRRVASALGVTGLVVALVAYTLMAGRYTLLFYFPGSFAGLGLVADLLSGDVPALVQSTLYGTGWVLVIVAVFRAGDRATAPPQLASVDERPCGPASAASLVALPAGLSVGLPAGFAWLTFLDLGPYVAALVAVLVLWRRDPRTAPPALWACLVPLAGLVVGKTHIVLTWVTATQTTALSITLGLARDIATNLAVTAGCVLLVLAYLTRGRRR